MKILVAMESWRSKTQILIFSTDASMMLLNFLNQNGPRYTLYLAMSLLRRIFVQAKQMTTTYPIRNSQNSFPEISSATHHLNCMTFLYTSTASLRHDQTNVVPRYFQKLTSSYMNQQVTVYPILIVFCEGLTTAFLRHMLLVKEVKLLQ